MNRRFSLIKKLFPGVSTSVGLFRFTFYFLMLAGFGVFVFQGFLDYRRFDYLFFGNRLDFFMDFFNPLFQSLPRLNVYNQVDAIYLPFAFSIYTLLASFIPAAAWTDGPLLIRDSAWAIGVFGFYMVVTLCVFVWELLRNKKGRFWERLLFSVSILFSAPFLYQFDRANLIFWALLFLMGFIFLKDSEKPWQRQVALLCLAAAANIKIYPAVFGLLLLKDGRWKDILRVSLYTLLLFTIPFLWYGGLGKAASLYTNLIIGVEKTETYGFGFIVDLKNTLRLIYYFIYNTENEALFRLFSRMVLFCLVWGCAAALFVKARWKAIGILSCLMILIPGISYFYSLIFLLIPLMLFLDDESEKTIKDYIYLILFLLVLVPICPGKIPLATKYFPLYTNMLVARLAVTVLFFLLLIEGTRDGFSVLRQRLCAKKGGVNE